MLYFNYNGQLATTDIINVPSHNTAFRYGYGLFETMLVKGHEIERKEYHWERLFQGMNQLGFALPEEFTRDFLEVELLRTVAKNELSGLCRVRLQIFAGDIHQLQPSFVVECFPVHSSLIQFNEVGYTLGIASNIIKSADQFANLKTTNHLPYIAATRQAQSNGWDDALITNGKLHIIESSIANIFWVKDGVVYTPSLSEGCIAGTMRRYLIASISDYPMKETSLTVSQLYRADEVFLTNAIRRIKWVQQIGVKSYTNNVSSEIYSKLFS